MARWGEIKCNRCEELETNRDALIEQMRDLCQQIEAAARLARVIAIEVRKDTLAELKGGNDE